MMWNVVAASLLSGATALLYDGNPGYPDMNVLWKFAEETGMTVLRHQRELPYLVHEGRCGAGARLRPVGRLRP